MSSLLRSQSAWMILCSVLVCLVVWIPHWPPLVDLPQHAAQIAMLHAWDEPGFAPLAADLRRNPFTPYLVGYGLAYVLAWVVSVPTALKLVLTGAVLAVPLVVRWALVRTGGDPAWALLAYPVALGFGFWFGFLNFLVGLPFVLLTVALSFRYAEAPGWRLGLALSALCVALVPVHAVTALLAGSCAGVAAIARPGSWRERVVRGLPFVSPLPALAAWMAMAGSAEDQMHQAMDWNFWAFRPLQLFSYLLTNDLAQLWTVPAGMALVALPLLLGARASRTPWRWLPMVWVLVLFFAIPRVFFGTHFVGSRLPALVYLLYLLALDRPTERASPALPVWGGTSAGLLLVMVWRVIGFDADTAPLARVVDQIPPHQRVLSLVFPTDTARSQPDSAYLHLPQWYVVSGHGTVDFSFATYYPLFVRYTDEARPSLPLYVDVLPERFDYAAHGGERWGYFVLRSDTDRSGEVFPPGAVSLVTRDGPWWLYEGVGGR